MNKQERGKALGMAIGVLSLPFMDGLFLMIAWNAIAPKFNLPTFSYWVCFAVMWTLKTLVAKLTPKKEGTT